MRLCLNQFMNLCLVPVEAPMLAHRFEVGAEETVVPLAEPQTPLTALPLPVLLVFTLLPLPLVFTFELLLLELLDCVAVHDAVVPPFVPAQVQVHDPLASFTVEAVPALHNDPSNS